MGRDCCVPKPQSGRFAMEYRPGRGWFVIASDGRKTGQYSSRDKAQMECERKQAAEGARRKRGPRPCMSRGREFISAGIHNRLCDTCRRLGHAPDLSHPAARRAAAGRA